jgi:hypothetical protein
VSPTINKERIADFVASSQAKALLAVSKLNANQLGALMGDERAMEHLPFKERDELIVLGLACRRKAIDSAPYVRTHITMTGLFARAWLEGMPLQEVVREPTP